ETPKVITEILESIASIPDSIQRQVYVQYLHQKMQKFQKVKETDLFEQLERVMNDKRWEEKRAKKREEVRNRVQKENENKNHNAADDAPPHPGMRTAKAQSSKKKPHYEKELIRLMISYGRGMVEYICSFTNARLFEDDELKMFYEDIIDRYKEEKEFSINVYSGKPDPFPRLVGDVSLQQYSASERFSKEHGLKYDENPYRTAKSSIRATQINFYRRKLHEIADRIAKADEKERLKLIERQKDVKSKLTRRETTDPDDLYPDPEKGVSNEVNEKVFTYKMKGEK
ncbi:MAG: DNA primase, partial [Gracilimonas sp.]|nr:DNA primase [Gracilimonas sp.]